jgi:hypothetical protein
MHAGVFQGDKPKKMILQMKESSFEDGKKYIKRITISELF